MVDDSTVDKTSQSKPSPVQ
jgi:hypothetical protein